MKTFDPNSKEGYDEIMQAMRDIRERVASMIEELQAYDDKLEDLVARCKDEAVRESLSMKRAQTIEAMYELDVLGRLAGLAAYTCEAYDEL